MRGDAEGRFAQPEVLQVHRHGWNARGAGISRAPRPDRMR
jgi:hypothetical protein